MLLFLFSILAGLIGALTGLGGGIVVIPVLVLLFKVNLHYAMGASLISVIATSTGSASAYIRQGYTNLRIGLFLEVAAVIGALIGALLIAFVSKSFIAVMFSLVLFVSAFLNLKQQHRGINTQHSHPWAVKLKLDGVYGTTEEKHPYCVQNVPLALSIMGIAGMFSGLLGIGSGALKVLAMDQAMCLPYKVSTTTSNFMIGITGSVSAGIYFSQGYINPAITFPVMLGVLFGSIMGAKFLVKMHDQRLRLLFSIVICFIGLQMLYKAITGTI